MGKQCARALTSPPLPQPHASTQGSADQWRWTLNWDEIDASIVVGSCPRTPADVATLAADPSARPTAILCLQSDLCWDALGIDGPAVIDACRDAGILHARVAVRDFDHADQAMMLPEAVRLLATLIAGGHRVYVHCTAGINRATLTVVAFYTFVRGASLQSALRRVKAARPQAHPYVDCWRTVRARLLEGRGEEVAARARAIYLARSTASETEGEEEDGRSRASISPAVMSWGSYDSDGGGGASSSSSSDQSAADWTAAEAALIREGFARSVACVLSLVRSVEAGAAREREGAVAAAAAAAGRVADEEAAMARAEAAAALGGGGGGGAGTKSLAPAASLVAELEAARAEVAALRVAVRDILAATAAE